MNFIDAVDVPEAHNPPADAPAGAATLNEEVTQVVGHLGRLWGGFRRQTMTAIESTRKLDLATVVTQAQTELGKYVPAEVKAAAANAPSAASLLSGGKSPKRSTTPMDSAESSDAQEERDPAATTPTPQTSELPSAPIMKTFFERLQATIPPNLVSTVQTTVQANIPATLKTEDGRVDFTNIRNTVTAELQRVQGITRAQAEDYASRADTIFSEAIHGAENFIRDAVKVVPPEEAAKNEPSGLFWAGTDVWAMDLPFSFGGAAAGEPQSSSGDVNGKGKVAAAGAAADAVATRAQALLRRLKHERELHISDPSEDEDLADTYEAWVTEQVKSQADGMQGPEWTKKIEAELGDESDGDALKSTRDSLVPSDMNAEEFWSRYFFRVHQVQQEEQRRKALLQGSITKEDEDFSWDNDEEESQASPVTSKHVDPPSVPSTEPEPAPKPAQAAAAEAPATKVLPAAQSLTPQGTSPRHSSEGSYDVVSSNVSNVDGGEKKTSAESDEEEEDDEEEESDWE